MVLKEKQTVNIPLNSIQIGSNENELPDEIQMLPFGWIKSKKGTFLVDKEAIQSILNRASQSKNEMVIDYEHQTLYGGEAPAAAWIKSFIDKGEQGLWAKVEWTPRAQQYIQNREYRYLSPVVVVRKQDKRVIAIQNAGLTNAPAIDGMIPVINKTGDNPEEEKYMDLLQQLIELLGLSADATPEDVLAAIQDKMKQRTDPVVANKEVLQLLDLPDKSPLEHVTGKILALKDKSGYVSAKDFADLQNRLNERDGKEAVDLALKSGKIVPAQKEWAETYAMKDPAGFKAFVDKQPQVVPVETEVAGGKDVKASVTNDVQLSINKMLDVSDVDFQKEWGEKE